MKSFCKKLNITIICTIILLNSSLLAHKINFNNNFSSNNLKNYDNTQYQSKNNFIDENNTNNNGLNDIP